MEVELKLILNLRSNGSLVRSVPAPNSFGFSLARVDRRTISLWVASELTGNDCIAYCRLPVEL